MGLSWCNRRCRRRNAVKLVPLSSRAPDTESERRRCVLERVVSSSSVAEAEEWHMIARCISVEELALLEQLRDELKDCAMHPACYRQPLHQQPEVLLRFLRARNGNIPQAALMFRTHLDWRKAEDVEKKLGSVRAELAGRQSLRSRLIAANRLVTDIGIDNYGVPVKLVRMASVDMAALREVVEGAGTEGGLPGPEFWTKTWLLQTHDEREVLRSTMFKTGQFVPGYAVVVDVSSHGCDGWYSRVAFYLRCFVKEAIQLFEPNYPEQARAYFVCGASPAFMALYNVVKRLIKPDLRRKYQIFPNGTDLGPALREILQDPSAPLPLFLESDSAEAQAEAVAGISSKFFPAVATRSDDDEATTKEAAAADLQGYEDRRKTRGSCFCW